MIRIVLAVAMVFGLMGCARSHDTPDAVAGTDGGAPAVDADEPVEDGGAPVLDACTSAAELCNAADDDCDGLLDEAPAGAECAALHATTACVAGACVPTCESGWADCDREAGCETAIETNVASCGACGHACGPAIACRDGVCDDERIVAISAGFYHACALRQSGEALCWGSNDWGQLGTGDTTTRLVPAVVSGGGDYVSITTGYESTCTLRRDGRLACWGNNAFGELGLGAVDFEPVTLPTPVVGIDQEIVAVELSAGTTAVERSALALAVDGTLWGWGSNYFGQLSVTRLGESSIATPFRTGFTAASFTLSNSWGCRAGSDGTLSCWGLRADYDFGGLDVRAVNGGFSHVCVLDASGSMYCAGSNARREVGPFECDPCQTAELLPIGDGVRGIALGDLRTCAILASGLVQCWGDNIAGTGSEIQTMPDLTGVTAIAMGTWRTCALDARARVWCWNDNNVGDGTVERRPFPTEVVGLYPAARP